MRKISEKTRKVKVKERGETEKTREVKGEERGNNIWQIWGQHVFLIISEFGTIPPEADTKVRVLTLTLV